MVGIGSFLFPYCMKTLSKLKFKCSLLREVVLYE